MNKNKLNEVLEIVSPKQKFVLREDRKTNHKQKRYDQHSKFIKECREITAQADATFNQGKYQESKELWDAFIKKADNRITKEIKIDNFNEVYSNALYKRAKCLTQLKPNDTTQSQIIEDYIQAYKMCPNDDTFEQIMRNGLAYKKNYEQLQPLAIEGLRSYNLRSLPYEARIKALESEKDKKDQHKELDKVKVEAEPLFRCRAITQTMLAQLAIDGELTLPWEKLITTYLASATQHFFYAYSLLAPRLIRMGHYKIAQLHMAEAKNKKITPKEKAWVLQREAECYYHPHNPTPDFNKAVELLEEAYILDASPSVCFALVKCYDKTEVKLHPERAKALYKTAAEGGIAQAAFYLGWKYSQGKTIQDDKEASKWYEIAVKARHPTSCYNYAIMLMKDPSNLNRSIELLGLVRNKHPRINFLYIKLRLHFLNVNDIFYGKQPSPAGIMTTKEAQAFYQDLINMNKSEVVANTDVQLLAGVIQEFILKDVDVAIDHYRAAAEYGSLSGHNKLYLIYTAKILAAESADQKYYIRSLQSILDSRKFFFNKELPTWAFPSFNFKEFKQNVSEDFKTCGDCKNFIQDTKSESPLNRIRNQLTSSRSKLNEVMKLDYEDIDPEHHAELVRYAGELANNIIVEEGAASADFLYEQLFALLTITVKKLKAHEGHFNLWSLMSILQGVGKFKIFCKEKEFLEKLHFLFNIIRSKLHLFGSWKLIMLLETAKNLCYELPGVPKFMEDIIDYTLQHWFKLFIEVDGAIKLCHLLAILNNHYHFFPKKTKLSIALTKIIETIVKTDISEYKSRIHVVNQCFFALNYFQGIKMGDYQPILVQLQTVLSQNPPRTTCSGFQREVVNFVSRYFSFPVWKSEISCVESKEEKIFFTKPLDLGITFLIPNPPSTDEKQKNKPLLVDVAIEADGTPHFWQPVSTLENIPIYNLDTLFYRFVLNQLGVNIIGMEYFVWRSLKNSGRYELFQKELAKFGLDFPSFSEVKALQQASLFGASNKLSAMDLPRDHSPTQGSSSDESEDALSETDLNSSSWFETTEKPKRDFKKFDKEDTSWRNSNWRIKPETYRRRGNMG